MDTSRADLQQRRWAPLLLGAVTLLLTLYLAYQSSELHRAELALREHEALFNEQPHFKVYQAWRMVRYDHVLDKAGPQMDEYQRLVENLRNLVDKRGAVQSQLMDASELRLLPPALASAWAALRLLPSSAAAPVDVPANAAPPVRADDLCKDTTAPPAAARPLALPTRDLVAHEHELDCFLQVLQINPDEFWLPIWSPVFDTRYKVNLLMSWLLPGVYGLLGACFYLMRTLLQGQGVRASPGGRAVAAVDILLRLAAGGLAGIIVGWFWVPAAGQDGLPSLSFGVAFLAGFSTDAMFSLLDRLMRNLQPAPATEPTEHPAGSAAAAPR